MEATSNQCIICSASFIANSTVFASRSVLDKHLEVIFLLRKVLEVPVSQLAKFLEGRPNVEEWISVCQSCGEMVSEAKLIYCQLLELNRKWEDCKLKIAKVVKQNINDGEEEINWDQQNPEMDLAKCCRNFVKGHDYEPCSNPFYSGDFRAFQLAQFNGMEDHNDNLSLSSLDSVSEDSNDHDNRKQKVKSSKKHPKPKSKSLSCHICGLTLSSNRALRSHLFSRHSVGQGKAQCDLCQKGFGTKEALKKHRLTCQNSKSHNWSDQNFMPPGNHFQVKCPISGCSETWPIVSAYRAHLKSQHTEEERQTMAKFPKILECLTCGKLVRNKADGLLHLVTHDEGLKREYQLVCDVCGLAFVGKKRLTAHKKSSLQCRLLQGQSESDTTVVCDLCGNRYSTKDTLKLHIKLTHQKKYSQQCAHCEKGFPDKPKLNAHLAQTHGIVEEEGVVLKCPMVGCAQTFYHKASWKNHQLQHQLGEPGHKCQECGKAFYTGRSLREHVKGVHRGYRRKPKTAEVGEDSSSAYQKLN